MCAKCYTAFMSVRVYDKFGTDPMSDNTHYEAAAHEANALPVMLPGKLVGRDKILATIYSELKQEHPVLLHGAVGNGKTAIAATLASAYTQQPGGALWLGVDGDNLNDLIIRVGRAYNDMDIANSDTPHGMIGAAATLLAHNKPLIVLDGNPLLPAVREFINKLAHNLPVMIVTEQPTDAPWQQVEIPPLDPPNAVMLFQEKSGLSTPEAAEIVQVLGHQPLAVLIAAGTARIAKLDAAALLRALQGATETTPANVALQVGFGQLQQGLQGILLMLGATFEGKASLELLTMLTGAQTETVQKVMTILAASGFVQQDMRYGAPYYYLHPSVHHYAQQYLQADGRLNALRQKVKDTVVAYAKKHSTPDTTDHDKLTVEMDTFLAASHWASEQGEGDVASQIVVSLTQAGNFVKSRGYLHDLLQLKESGSSGVSAFPANAYVPPTAAAPEDFDDDPDEMFADSQVIAENTTDLSPEEMMQANTPELDPTDPDSLRVAIMDARGNDDKAREYDLQEQLGQLLVSQGKVNEALAVYNELLVSYEDDDNIRKIMETRLQLAKFMVQLQSSQAAVLHATQGARLAGELDDTLYQAQLLILLGDARQQLGESTEAITAYSQALGLAQTAEHSDLQATAQMQLGFAQLDDADAETAIKTWEQALKLCRELEKRDCEGRILGGLGTAYGDLQRWEEALNFHNSALYIAREVGDKKEEALQLSNLGYAAKKANKLADAVLRYRQALHLAYQYDERANIVSNIVDLARILSQSTLHLDIADMLVNDALTRDPNDREVLELKQSITSERMMAVANDIALKPVKGTAQDYAAAAYSLLEA